MNDTGKNQTSIDFFLYYSYDIKWLEGGNENMINFEEEIEKFQPSLEVDEAEDAIYNNDVTDVTDIIQDILSEMKKN